LYTKLVIQNDMAERRETEREGRRERYREREEGWEGGRVKREGMSERDRNR
jgi:hypothetical protein